MLLIPCPYCGKRDEHEFTYAREGHIARPTNGAEMTDAEWAQSFEFSLLNSTVRSTPRKVVLHVLTHEIRHWAQVATLLRLQGWVGERQDLLFSPVFGEPVQLQEVKL